MILMYHKVFPEARTKWWVTPNAFWRQMEELRGHTVVPLDEYDPDNRKHVVITFDGVYENVFGHAVPIMKKFGYPFELFIVGETIGQENRFDQPAEPPARFANIEQIESMVHEGGRLQWHSRSHKDLTKVEDSKSLDHELRVPDDLRKLDPKGFRWFAYPHGEVSSKLIERTKKFFRGGLSCVQGNGSDPYQLNRLMVDNDTKFQHSTVSLIIANYNYGRFAPEAIESALRQTVYPDEILFIDDGSTDNSIEIAGRYGDHIRIVRNKKNLGIIKTFNKAASLTKGDYICFLGADNRFRSDYVEKCKRALDTNEDAAIAYTDVVLFGPRAEVLAQKLRTKKGTKIKPVPHTNGLFLWEFPEFDEISKRNLKNINFMHGSSMFRRCAFEEVGGYRESEKPEDHNLFLRMISKEWKSVRCPGFLLEYRQHSSDQVNTQYNVAMELAHVRRQLREKERELSNLEGELRAKESHLSTFEAALNVNNRTTQHMSEMIGSMQNALPALESMIESLKEETLSSKSTLKVGELCFSLGLFETARRFFRKTLTLDPRNSDALNNLGVLTFQLDDYEAARGFFMRAVDVSPENKEARENLAELNAMEYRGAGSPRGISPKTDVGGSSQGPVERIGRKRCNLCGWEGDSFSPMINPTGTREGARCPECASLERHRALKYYLENLKNLKGKTILDFAPARGFREFFADQRCAYFGADLKRTTDVQCDVTHLPFRDDSIDMIICYHVLEHVRDDRRALSQIFQILKEDGIALIQVPFRPDLAETEEYVTPDSFCHDHVRAYGRDVRERIEKAGFEISERDFSREVPTEHCQRLGFAQNSGVTFVAEKNVCSGQAKNRGHCKVDKKGSPSGVALSDCPENMAKMRRYWDRCAVENARKHIAVHDWESESRFHRSGEEDLLRILDSSYIDLCNGARVLEVGVGVGRLLKPLAMMRPDLDIYGIDVSKEMIRQGRERLKDLPKIHLFATGGNDLSPFSDGFFDLVFSYITFQHIPRAYVVNYFKEIHRVLKEGAIFRFQMQSPGRSPVKEPSNNDFRSIRYYGTEKIEHMCHDFGFRPLELTGTSYIWVTAEKSTRDGT